MSIKQDIKKGFNKVEKQIAKTIRGTSLSLMSTIIKDTPADTGRLRGNWDITMNKESSYKDESTQDKSGTAAVSKGKLALNKYKIGDTVYLTNNIEYAIYVEDGTANQRGHHMVERAKLSFNSQLEKNAAKFRIR